ncbi:MAG TPA: hypothetical protein VK534_00500 [Methylomirabilota bacterium]|nr:hypothetical protein [Methylomirabilota bacterium]
MAQTLQTSSNSGSQSGAQSPQTATQSGTGGTSTKVVQPGAANASLNQSSAVGLSLTGTVPTAVSLSSTPSTSTRQVTQAPAPARDFNPALIAIPVILVLVGAALMWAMRRSVKNTTH